MPHMVISYAKPLADKYDMQSLVQSVWDAANETGLFTASAIKA